MQCSDTGTTTSNRPPPSVPDINGAITFATTREVAPFESVHRLLPHPLVPQGSLPAVEGEALVPALVAPEDLEGRRYPTLPTEGPPHKRQDLEAPPAEEVAHPPRAAYAVLALHTGVASEKKGLARRLGEYG